MDLRGSDLNIQPHIKVLSSKSVDPAHASARLGEFLETASAWSGDLRISEGIRLIYSSLSACSSTTIALAAEAAAQQPRIVAAPSSGSAAAETTASGTKRRRSSDDPSKKKDKKRKSENKKKKRKSEFREVKRE
jgi:hypothetical protein